jgi:uncharacterized protein (DUF4415 family)
MAENVKERYYTVTEADYQEDLAKGLSEEEMMKPGKYKVIPSRFRPKPGDTDLRNCKVKITMYIDADVLEYFKTRAEQPNAAPYQTQINNELRKMMESGSNETSLTGEEMLNDKKFLKALKKKLDAV